MGLNSIKNFFILFCLFNLTLNQNSYILKPQGTTTIPGEGEKIFTVGLQTSSNPFDDYIRLVFTLDNQIKRNPSVIVWTDNNTKERLYTSVQLYDKIYIFLKYEQILNNQFYINIQNRENSNVEKYNIEVRNQKKAYLPFNQQTSYYIPDDGKDDSYVKQMEFILEKDDSTSSFTDISFWAQGKNIISATTTTSFENKKFEASFVTYAFYGAISSINNGIDLKVESANGDYITVGSVIMTDKNVLSELKENRNEILVASTKKEVCFPILYTSTIMYITGKIYTFKANSFFKDKDGKPFDEEKIFTNGILNDINPIGYISEENRNKIGHYCLNSSELLIFSIQMTTNINNTQLVTPPLLPGDIRRHFLERGQIAIFYGTKPRRNTTEVNFNLKSLRGFPEMYYTECKEFPNCYYTPEDLNSLVHPYPSNRFATYSFYMKDEANRDFSPITAEQPLMIVYCNQGGKDDIFGESSFCTFETTIFTSDDHVLLPQESTFSQYLLSGDIDYYQVDFPEVAKEGTKIYLDLMLFSGDVDLEYQEQEGVTANKYYISNKIFYSVHLNEGMQKIIFKVIGKSNAFYIIQYQIINSNEQSDDKNTIESGVNYITTKNVDQTDNLKKYLYLKNFKVEYEEPYLVTFYSPNCKFDAFWDSNSKLEPQKISLSFLDNYAYTIIGSNNPYYDQEEYKFYYKIQEADISEFPKKFCAVNVAGLELSNSDKEWNGRSISLSEGVPHTYVFSNEYPLIYYSYHASNINNTLVLNFNLIDKATFNVTIKVNRKNPSTSTIYRNTQLYVIKDDFEKNCLEDEVCTVDVEVLMWNSTGERKVELIMYQLDGLPFYLEKNVLRDDILNGNNPKHYYFDIGSDEYGDITLDFKRGSGFIYATVVPRINPVKPENPDWRGLYKFPTSISGTLKYMTYDKKIMITPKDTENCTNSGCYVLITIEGNLNLQSNVETPYRISIIPRIMKIDNTIESPKVKINVNEFIIGSILKGQAENRKYDFYTLILPYNSDYILIDWQADNPTLVINVGPKRPTRENRHFYFPAIDHDTVYRINRSDIIDNIIYDDDDNSTRTLKNVELTIGIYSDTSDSLQSSPYAFKLFMPPIIGQTDKGEVISAEIIHIRSDQKVQCLPFEYDTGIYICLFAVIFDDTDVMNDLIAYPRSQDGYPIDIYGNFVNAKLIETNDMINLIFYVSEIFRDDYRIPEKYIYRENINKDESFLFIVQTEDPDTIIEVLSSTYNIRDGMTFYPNPSTPQILALKKYKIEIEIFTSQDLLINLGSVSGTGAIYWADEENDLAKKYYLNDLGDKLSLTNYKDEQNKLYTPLKVDSLVDLDNVLGGFIFYITFYPRSYIDRVKSDSTTEIQYRTVRMPVDYYVPVKLFYPNTINLNIYNMDTQNGEDLVYDSDFFDVWGTLISNTEAVTIRVDPRFRPNINEVNYTKGVFDIIFATLYFSEKDMEKFKPKEGEGNIPNIFFTLEPKNNVDNTFTSFGLELDISSIEKEFGAEPVPEGIYLTGNLANTMFGKKAYLLKLDPNKHYLRIEYSSNSYFVNFALSSNVEAEENDNFTNINVTEEYGKNVMIVKFEDDYFSRNITSLYFIVFTKHNNADSKLQYFVLKYLTLQKLESFPESIKPASSRLNITNENGDKRNFVIKFHPLFYDIGVTYFIKAVYEDQVIFEENINSIAISEAKGKNVQITKPNKDNGMIIYTLNSDKEISYIKVLVRFNFLYGKYIYLYTPYETDINEITYCNNCQKQITNAKKKERYELLFAPNIVLKDLKNYIKITVNNYKGDKPPVLYFSPTDSKCIENRAQLAKGGEMWISKQQFSDHFYFLVECLDANECSYTLTFSEDDTVVFDSTRIFSYYVNSFNTNMVFKFKNEHNSDGDYITLYATGGKNTKIVFDECKENCDSNHFTDGVAITTKTKGTDNFTLNVTAEIGDYITVGAKIIDKDGKSYENTLSPRTGQISGFLKNGSLEKECYLIQNDDDIYYITGTLYNSYAIIALVDSDNMEIDENNATFVKKGFFSLIYNNSINQKNNYLCIAMIKTDLYEVESFSYSIQLQSKNNFIGDIYPPQYPGSIYPGIIPTGKLAYFNYMFPHTPSNYSVYNMITTEGYPKMYVYECFSYPLCELDYNTLEKNKDVKRISDINRMSTYFVETRNMGSPIDAHQHILVVKCINATGDAKDDYNHCSFMTSSFGEKEEVELLERQPFGQYMIKGDTDQFLIDISKETKDKLKIHIDFYVVSGDVSFELTNKESNENLKDIHKYYLANKIFYSLTIDKKNNVNANLKYIRIQTTAKLNSYYIVEYKVLRDELEEKTNSIFSSINYLISISQNSTGAQDKTLIIKGIKIVRPRAFIDTFYSLNCKINIQKVIDSGNPTPIPSFGDYAQEFHQLKEGESMNYERAYIISINQNEKYVLNKNDMCMIYVSGLEMYNTNSGVRKEILLSEGVPHLVHFDPDLKIMRYIYPHAEPRKNITVSLNMIIPGKFKINYFFREQEYNIESDVSQSTILYIPNYVIQTGCQEEDELCSVTVQLENTEQFDGVEPIVELTIKQVKNTPYYVPRGIIRKDYISGEAYLFLYTDVGKDEGYITVNFDRESGFVYGKIVEIYQEKPDDNADWRNYRFIRDKTDPDSLYYDFYNKKLLFNSSETDKCGYGCYILISIKTSVYKENIDDSEYQYFTLLADFSPKNYEEKGHFPKLIQLVPEEYIIGSIYKKDEINGKVLYDYYTFEIPYNISAIEIDWQSDIAGLLINIGQKRPSDYSKSHFNFTERRDTNIRLSRLDILKKNNGDNFTDDGRSLQGLDITFAVYTKYYDSIDSTPYAFRVHLPKPELNIYKITSDQKAICKPEKLDDNLYRCLFMIIYQQFELFNDLIVYAKSQSPSARVNMFANFTEVELYNSYNVQELKKIIPTETNSLYNTKRDLNKFIFLSYGNFDSNAFVSVISDKPDDIELYTSFKTFEDRLSPNPSTAQVYSMDLLKYNISLDFITTKGLSVNIMSLYGEARLYLEKDPQSIFYLRGAEDCLDYIIKENEGSNTLLIVENLRYGKTEYKNPGFAFVLEFYLRNKGIGIDLIKIDETSEIAYKQSDFPVYYYAKVFNTDNDINGFFYLHDIIYDNIDSKNRIILADELVINATVMEENKIYEIKEDSSKIPNNLEIQGVYDSTLKAGSILIPKDKVKSLALPTIFIAIEKGKNGNSIKYNKIRGELGFSTINGEAPVTEKLYQFGKVKDYANAINYKLSTDIGTTKYMRIQFSCNSKYVNFAINKQKDKRENETFTEFTAIKERGIVFVTFKKPVNVDYLYLIVFLGQDSGNEKLNNYVFKYINADSIDGFFEYKIVNDNPQIEIQKNNNNLIVKFYPIYYKESDKSDKNTQTDTTISYTIKIVTTSDSVNNENANVIAITQSNINDKYIDSDYTLTQKQETLTNVPNDIKYVQIIATITQGSIIEYVAYQAVNSTGGSIVDPDPVEVIIPIKPTDTPTDTTEDPQTPKSSDESKKDDNNTGLYVIIGVSSFLLVVVVVLIIVIVRYNSKNKDLLSQVNKISFVQSEAAENKDDANLLLDNQNELD